MPWQSYCFGNLHGVALPAHSHMQVTWCIVIDVVHWKPIGVTAGAEARLLGMKGFELAMLTSGTPP
jgi:hypothetical protein